MTDLFDEAATNVIELSVSDLSFALKKAVEEAFGQVRVRGEISGYRGPHASGHAYFSLKDDKARIEAVIWRVQLSKLTVQPEEGMEVVVVGRLTTYPGSSKYQIVIEALEPAGLGALMVQLEARKRRLAGRGLFDAQRKKPLPFMPSRIGVITSPTGAVIRDIIHRIADRFPLHIIIRPVRVQGDSCASEVAQAITDLNNLALSMRPDVIIVARGGGSLEDLWGFNDEQLVEVASQSTIPLISAVGHETDWTLLDLVADLRAPTPTGAAELAVPVKADLEAISAALGARLKTAMRRIVNDNQFRLNSFCRALPRGDQLFAIVRRRFDEASSRLSRALSLNITAKKANLFAASRQLSPLLIGHLIGGGRRALGDQVRRLDLAWQRHLYRCEQVLIANARLLASVSYQNILSRGFTLTFDRDNKPIKRVGDVKINERMGLRFYDGEISIRTANRYPKEARDEVPASQADLFD